MIARSLAQSISRIAAWLHLLQPRSPWLISASAQPSLQPPAPAASAYSPQEHSPTALLPRMQRCAAVQQQRRRCGRRRWAWQELEAAPQVALARAAHAELSACVRAGPAPPAKSRRSQALAEIVGAGSGQPAGQLPASSRDAAGGITPACRRLEGSALTSASGRRRVFRDAETHGPLFRCHASLGHLSLHRETFSERSFLPNLASFSLLFPCLPPASVFSPGPASRCCAGERPACAADLSARVRAAHGSEGVLLSQRDTVSLWLIQQSVSGERDRVYEKVGGTSLPGHRQARVDVERSGGRKGEHQNGSRGGEACGAVAGTRETNQQRNSAGGSGGGIRGYATAWNVLLMQPGVGQGK